MAVRLEDYKVDGNEAIDFYLIRSQVEFDSDYGAFHPEMCHQVFGESEMIYGYRDLKVKLYYTAGSLQLYFDMKYGDKIDQKHTDVLRADNIKKLMLDNFVPFKCVESASQFSKEILKDELFKPFGNLLHSYGCESNKESRKFVIYHSTISTPGFLSYHKRLQTFLIYFIDAASYIDTDDEHWNFFVIYEKYKSISGTISYATVGYLTAYYYYCYPSSTRPRLSQFLILPPFQRQGHGSTLLKTFYNFCKADNQVTDITVEDPSYEFQCLRDYVDCESISELSICKKEALSLKSYSKEFIGNIHKSLKINFKQIRRCFEILLFNSIYKVQDETALKQYRLFVKQRLNKAFLCSSSRKFGADQIFSSLKEKSVEMGSQLITDIKSEIQLKRWEQLEQIYQECIQQYQNTILKLKF